MSVIKFGAWQDLSGNEVANSTEPIGDVGLVFIKSQTVGSGVSSVTVTGAFSATFDNYRVLMSGGTSSSVHDIKVQIGSSTTGYYGVLLYGQVGGASPLIASRNNWSIMDWVGGGDGVTTSASFDLFNPYQTMYTTIRNGMYQASGYGILNGEHRVSASHTTFTLSVSTGTITGGTIRVYGYRN